MQKWQHRIVVITFESENGGNQVDDISNATDEIAEWEKHGWEVAGIFPSKEAGKGKVVFKMSAEN